MLKDFMADVTALTGGEVTFEVLPAGAVVGVKETLDAVDAGLVEGGFAWTHYWSGKHQQRCCSVPLLLVLVLVSITSRSCLGSSMLVVKNFMTSCGMKWA